MNDRLLASGTLISILLMVVSATGANYTLEIFGNANMDDTIDEKDIAYEKDILNGNKEKTEFADANNDGQINEKDLVQIEAIINGEEKELILQDSDNRTFRTKIPLQRVVTCSRHFLEVAQSLKIPVDVIAAIPEEAKNKGYSILYPKYQDKPIVGCTGSPSAEIDCESIIGTKPDMAILYGFFEKSNPAQENLENAGVNVIRLNLNRPDIENLFQKEVTKLGYLFNRRDEARDLLNYYKKYEDLMKERLKDLPENEKPKVYYETFNNPYVTVNQFSRVDIAGGKNCCVD